MFLYFGFYVSFREFCIVLCFVSVSVYLSFEFFLFDILLFLFGIVLFFSKFLS